MNPALLNVPKTPADWAVWTFAHRVNHDEIRAAILAQHGINLTEYQLDPLPPDDVVRWQERVQQTHREMLAAVKSESADLQGADFHNPEALASWIWTQYQEDFSVRAILKI